jgi:hypothetical protein
MRTVLHHDRHPPDDTVAFRADREESAAAGRLLEDRHVTQQAGKIEQERSRIAAHCRYADRRPGAACLCHREGKARFADHDTRFTEGVGEHRIIARQRTQLGPCRFVKVAVRVRGNARRHPVGLRENHVERHHQRAHLSQTRNNVGDARARPRPLTDAVQAFFVNIDDDDRPLRCVARVQHLKEIEDADAKLLHQDGIGQP